MEQDGLAFASENRAQKSGGRCIAVLFDLFRKKAPAPKAEPEQEAECYSHMRVEVTTLDGQLLFVAKLMNHRGSTAELHQYSETAEERDAPEEPIPVRIRGYHDHLRKAVYMEGVITPLPKHIWQVEQLSVARVGNDRAFFRLDTDIEASVTKFMGRSAGERPCRLLNISVGGAGIALNQQYWEGDKLLLTVRLMEDRDPSIMYCEILRVIDRGEGQYEYGCKFLELTEADQEKITQNIFAAQRKKRNPSM